MSTKKFMKNFLSFVFYTNIIIWWIAALGYGVISIENELIAIILGFESLISVAWLIYAAEVTSSEKEVKPTRKSPIYKKRTWTKIGRVKSEFGDAIQKDYESGLGVELITKKYDISIGMLYNIVDRSKKKTPTIRKTRVTKHLFEPLEQDVIRDYLKWHSLEDIKSKYGLNNVQHIYSLLNKHKIRPNRFFR